MRRKKSFCKFRSRFKGFRKFKGFNNCVFYGFMLFVGRLGLG